MADDKKPTSDGYSEPDLPDQDGYSIPDLGDDGTTNAASQQQGGPEQDAEEAGIEQQGRFDMKPLGADYLKGEKNSAAQKVQMGGQEVEVHEKEWMRKQSTAQRATEGKAPVTDEVWKAKVATTQYMNDQQREDHQVGFKPAADETGAQNAKLKGDSMRRGEEHIFVMDGEGEVFAKEAQAALNQKDETGRGVHVHHSSFLAGEAVAGAGEMKIDDTGFLKEVTDRSGHYKPGEAQTAQTLGALEEKGVNLNNVKFTLDRGTDKTTGMAKEFQQGGEQTFKARHTMADQIKERGKDVRAALDKDADRRATRVSKGDEHKAAGIDAGKVNKASMAHAAKDATTLEGTMKAALKDQGLKTPSVRDKLGGSVGKAQPPAGKGQSVS
ncbi:MAG: hypothetical protein ABL974_14280 [Prosthecobacter sp.]